MAIILSHSSALAFWTLLRIDGSLMLPAGCDVVPVRTSPLSLARATRKELARISSVLDPSVLDALALSCAVDVLVGQGRHYDKPRGLHAHSTTLDFAQGSFFRIAPDLFVVSPSLCFCQMGETLGLVDMIRLGDELCGTYAAREGKIAFSVDPLVTRPTLERRLRSLPPVRGKVRALQALRYVVGNSASPRETSLEAMLVLPRHRGGFGLPAPEMNGSIKVLRGNTGRSIGAFQKSASDGPRMRGENMQAVSRMHGEDAHGAMPRFQGGIEDGNGILWKDMQSSVGDSRGNRCPEGSFLRCDLLWRSSGVAVEYDSDSYHANAERIERDALRRDLLEHMGIHVLTVTRRRFSSLTMLEEFAYELRRALGVRFRTLTPKQEHARHALHAALMKQVGW